MFETYLYQPFFNILVGIYWLLGRIGPEFEDMGIAVIVFSLVVKLILFPLTIAGERSEEEKKKIVEQVDEAKRTYSAEPIKLKARIRQIMRSNLRSVIASTANLIIYFLIILILYRIFTTGLEGADFHLLYDFMPPITHVNLMFLGKFNLGHTNSTLNLYQSLLIFLVEFLIALRSPFPVPRRDVILLQVILPIGSYLIFMFMPAGKKVFLITSLVFSAVYHSFRLVQSWGRKLFARIQPPLSQDKTPEEQGVVEVVTPTTPTPTPPTS